MAHLNTYKWIFWGYYNCVIKQLFIKSAENSQNKGTKHEEDGKTPADFMFTLFIQQKEEVELTHSPRRNSSLSIVMKQKEVMQKFVLILA